MDANAKCEECGTELPVNAPQGLCPRCLVTSGLALLQKTPTSPPPASPGQTATRAGAAGSRIRYFGDYELLQEIARGGMGVVYKARQVSLNRVVAVKLLLFGEFASDKFVKRFQAEAEAVASLQHPNIVAIHEVGVHDEQPYFSMDYIEGQNLAERARDHPLPPELAAAYVRTIAQAIHYAHQHGVLHRDLKPSNVLIDPLGQPRITDFGLAKRLHSESDLTVSGQVLGTPNFMAPEQAAGKVGQFTMATDVYGLGAILYQLLTAKPPFAGATLTETLRLVLETEPTPPRVLNKTVAADLQVICLKCLEKDPEHRYASAQALADDLERWLRHEPLVAAAPGPVYRFRKFVRRHRAAVSTAAGILVLLIVATLVSSIEAIRAAQAERKALVQAKQSRQIVSFLQEMLGAVGPQFALGRDTQLVRLILEDAERRIAPEMKDQPEVAVELLSTIAGVYDQINEYEKAEQLCRKALGLQATLSGESTLTYAQLLDQLAYVLYDRSVDLEGARSNILQALELKRKWVPRNHPENIPTLDILATTLQRMNDLQGAETPLREALAIARNLLVTNVSNQPAVPPAPGAGAWSMPAPDVSSIAPMVNDLGQVLRYTGKLDEAEMCFREAMALHQAQTNEIGFSTSLGNLSLVQWEQGSLADAEETAAQALELRKRLLGTGHELYASALNTVALVQRDKGNLRDSEVAQRQSLAIVTNGNPVYSAAAQANLATVLRRRAASEGSLPLLREALHLDPRSPYTMEALAVRLAVTSLRRVDVANGSREALWQFTETQPATNWMSPEFSAANWQRSGEAPCGFSNCLARTDRSVTPHTNLWLRKEFELSTVPPDKVALRIGPYHNAEIYINGVPAAPVADWSDGGLLLPCQAAAQAGLKPGSNVLAVHSIDADGGVPIRVELCAITDTSFGWNAVLEEFRLLLADEAGNGLLHMGRANAFARCGRFSEAESDLLITLEQRPMDDSVWLQLAALFLERGDSARYERHRQEALARFAKPATPLLACRIATLSLLTPVSGSDLESAARLANNGVGAEYHDANLAPKQFCKALSEYRSGHFLGAIEWADKARTTAVQKDHPGWLHERERTRFAASCFVEAMAQYRLKHQDESGTWLRRGVEIVQTQFPSFDSGELGRNWADCLIARALMREAEGLVEPGTK